jgi:transposase
MKITDIIRQQIIKEYTDNMSAENIMAKYDLSLGSVYDLLRENNIPTHKRSSGLTLKNLDPDFVITEYGKGQSACKIAEQLGCSHTLILDFLSKYHIVKTDKNQLSRKHKTVKEDYFDIIDTQEKAYFLGLMFADGCNSIGDDSASTASINLQEGDKEILEKFSKAIFGEVILTFRDLSKNDRKNQYRLRIHNHRICKQLEKLGCIPVKSLTLEWPKWLIDPDLQRHFIRGYFDGDGTIYCRKNTHYYGFGIMSTPDFCINVDRVVNEHIQINFTYETCDNNITTDISVGGNRQILKILNWLYKDATIYLERKYQKYLELKAWTEDIDNRKNGPDHHINQYM